MTEIKPTAGRIVLYKDENGKQFPGIITHVHGENIIDLMVFKTNECVPFTSVPGGEAVRNWDWLPFQKDQQARLGWKGRDGQKEEVKEDVEPQEEGNETEDPTEAPVEQTVSAEAGEVEVEPKTTDEAAETTEEK
ncbi:MAG: hypothetical protein PHF35_04745 [Candidatus Moranbacteria bacterium]|nr:hypothetical protein [Candidatus Moranbacteria bacterium]